MAKLGKIQVDPDKQNNGVWVPYVLDIEVKVARMGNREYEADVRRASKPYTKGFRADKIPDSILEKITMKAVSKWIIKDWRGLEDDKGKKIPFSQKKALEFFEDDQYRDFYKFILSTANDADLYLREVQGDSEKN